jgi:hypothetical protein
MIGGIAIEGMNCKLAKFSTRWSGGVVFSLAFGLKF